MTIQKDQSWLTNYEELMFGEHYTIESMTKAAEMKAEHMPELLYKYRACTPETFEALAKDYLFSAQPKLFNDPFEGPISIVKVDVVKIMNQTTYNDIKKKFPFMPENEVASCQAMMKNINLGLAHLYGVSEQEQISPEILDILASEIDRFLDRELERNLDIARNMYNICCFSAINDETSMWEHYADHHQGFCIGYGIKDLDNNLTHCTFPVLYKANCQLYIHDLEEINGSNCMHMLTVKTPGWSNEQEWRILFKPNPPIHLEYMPIASEVYLGYMMPEEHQARLYDICIQKGISLFKMVPDHSQQKLIPSPLINKSIYVSNLKLSR